MRHIAVAFAVLAMPATAQELSFASMALDVTDRSTFVGDEVIRRFDGKAELAYGNFVLGVDAEAFNSTFIASQGTLQVLAGYRFAPGFVGGLSLGRTGKFGEMDDVWGLWLGYDGETFALGAESRTDETDVSTYTLAGEITPTPGLLLAGYVTKQETAAFTFYALEATYSAEAYDITALARISTGDDLDLLALRGTYRVGERFDLGAGYGEWQPSIGESRSALFVTAGYRLAESSRAFATLTSRDSGGADDNTGVRLGVTFDLGQSARTADRIVSRIDDLGWDFE